MTATTARLLGAIDEAPDGTYTLLPPEVGQKMHHDLHFAWIRVVREAKPIEEAGDSACLEGTHVWAFWSPTTDPGHQQITVFVRECIAPSCNRYQVRRVPPPPLSPSREDALAVGLLPPPQPK